MRKKLLGQWSPRPAWRPKLWGLQVRHSLPDFGITYCVTRKLLVERRLAGSEVLICE